MKLFIGTLFLLILSTVCASGLPQSPSQVSVVKTKDELNYEGMAKISKVFVGERNNTQTDELEASCQKWVYDQMIKKEAPYFRVWCTRTVDVIMREYRYTGNLLIKTWK